MSVTEIKQALGEWSLRLREDTPQQVLAALTFYGHIAILPGELPVAQYEDALLASARYVGVYRGRDAMDTFTLKGSGMAYWLGDEDGKGDVFETPVVLAGDTFADSVRALLPPGGAITEGVLHGGIPGTLSQTFQWQNSREAIGFVTDTFGAEYRVNYDGTLDAGTVSQLYATTPVALLMRKGAGADLFRKAISGRLAMGVDVEDVTTRVVLLAEGEGSSIVTADADAPPTPYKDLHGNPIKMTRLVSESGTEAANAAARAQLQLNRFLNARRSVQLNSSEYDIKGLVVVGDYLDVYDPENGFYDAAREVYWDGERINPMALRCVEMSWPVPPGWTVAFRDIDGNWIDLSPYYVGESGDTTIVVGELARGLSSVGGEAIGVRPNLPDTPGGTDTTIPAAPAFTDISTGSYQPDNGEWTKAAVFVSWNQPLNSDGSVITDGGHYEIRYRVNTWIGYQVRWGMLGTTPPGAGYRWGELSGNRWGAPITDPVETSQEWHIVYVGWGQTQMLIQELTPGMEYEFQIRAVDAANPPKEGPWSASEFVVASEDLFAPDVPAAPVVAGSRISIQVVHTLGKASGGTFNLQPDLVYLSVHVGGSSSFYPDDTNVVGKLIANSGMIQANIPAVGTFQIEQTDDVWVRVIAVDRAGNKSGPSEAVQASAELIDDAHISDLTVSKVTAGTIMANWILAAAIKTSETGARVELSNDGMFAFNSAGGQTVAIHSSDGSAKFTGELQTELNGAGINLFTTPGGQAWTRWSVNSASGPLDHVILERARDYGGAWGQGFEIGIKTRSGEIQDGGKVLMSEVTNIFSHQPTATEGKEAFMSLGRWPYEGLSASGREGMIYFQGRFSFNRVASDGAMWFYRWTTEAGFGGVSPSYGPTMEDVMVPIYSITGDEATTQHTLGIGIEAPTATGFTVRWSNTAEHTLHAWAFRMDNA